MSTSTLALPRPSRFGAFPSGDTVVVAAGAVVIALWFSATTPDGLHWFVLPATLSAVLIGGDALRWLRGKIGAFDPAGVLALLGVYMFFIAPLLHVRWDYWLRYAQHPPDWRTWLGAMAILNCMGLAAYRVGRAVVARSPSPLRTTRILDGRRFWIVLSLMLLLTAASQYWVYTHFGGVLGYIRAYEEHGTGFQGFGIVFLLSESFPILTFIGFAVLATRFPRLASWGVLLVVLLAFFGLKIFFGGLRGSRANTVWGLFWALGIIHLWIRPLPRRALLGGLPLLAAFMFGWGLYKAATIDGLAAILQPARAIEIAARSGRTLQSMLLSDFARADIQAHTLWRVQNVPARDLGWGRTYLGGIAILIPRSIYPARPPTKIKEGTIVTYGHAAWEAGRVTSRVYGLAGEALLNVGIAGVPVVFLLLGFLVGGIRRAYYGMARFDARTLLLPLWVVLAVVVLVGDSDNIVFFLFKEASVPLLLVLLTSRSVRNPCA